MQVLDKDNILVKTKVEGEAFVELKKLRDAAVEKEKYFQETAKNLNDEKKAYVKDYWQKIISFANVPEGEDVNIDKQSMQFDDDNEDLGFYIITIGKQNANPLDKSLEQLDVTDETKDKIRIFAKAIAEDMFQS